jgi:hypothetical protein
MIGKIEVCKYRGGALFLEREVTNGTNTSAQGAEDDLTRDALALQGSLIKAFTTVPQEDRSGFDEPDYQPGEGHPQMDRAMAADELRPPKAEPVFEAGRRDLHKVSMALTFMMQQHRAGNFYFSHQELLDVEKLRKRIYDWYQEHRGPTR